MLAGNTKEVGKRIENVYTNGGENFSGLGSTLEGFDVNPFMYEYVFSKAWDCNLPDSVWIEQLADRRIGLKTNKCVGHGNCFMTVFIQYQLLWDRGH